MPEARHLDPVAVVGLGLVGGSLLRALGVRGRGYDPAAATSAAAAADGVDVRPTLDAALDGAAAVVLAAPLPALPGVLRDLAGVDALVTDVGSVKWPVLAAARDAGVRRFVGGHPMAGTERSGWAAGDPALFRGARWVLCLEPDTDLDDWLALARLVTDLGALAVPLPAATHDRAVARVSHLPYLLAAALAVEAADPVARALAAGSFRDGTRVAGGDPALPVAMVGANGDEVVGALDDALQRLGDLRTQIAAGRDVRPAFEAARSARRAWEQRGDGAVAEVAADRDALLALGAAGGAVTSVHIGHDGVRLTALGPHPPRRR